MEERIVDTPDEQPDPSQKGSLGELAHQGIEARVLQVLDQSGARDARSILSLLRAFPTLAERGLIDSPTVSSAVTRMAGEFAFLPELEMAEIAIVEEVHQNLGAIPPPEARWQIADEVPLLEPPQVQTTGFEVSMAGETESQTIDLRACMPWPVRNQGPRGTCVSFAITALCELKECQVQNNGMDLSEQFMHWAIKTHTGDPDRNRDGTWLRYALDALGSHGIPAETSWAYDPTVIPGNTSHGSANAPTTQATQEALQRRGAGLHATPKSGAAAEVLAILQEGRAVAVSLPVFEDPISKVSNWTTAVGIRFGFVLDPPPTSVVAGGHAVTITGFAVDAAEPSGGYFIIRNSWSAPKWGNQLPDPSWHGPEAGYGQVSATYIDRFLWEYAAL